MRRQTTLLLLAVLLLVAAGGVGRAQTGGGQAAPPPRPQTPPPGANRRATVDQGRLEGGTYTNDFFGISFSTPPGWIAQDMAARQAIIDAGKKVIGEGMNERKKAEIESSVERSVYLLSVSKYELNSYQPSFNAQMSLLAERVPTAVVKTGGDYITQMIRVAQGSAAKLEVTRPVRPVRVGGAPFAVADAKLTIGLSTVAQRYYATVRNGYALLFAFAYVDEPDVQTFEEVIKSVRFK